MGALVSGPDIRIGGGCYAPGPVDGVFSLPGPLPSGYIWTYLSEGTDFTAAPDLVVVMPGYEAPHRWTEHLLTRARRDLVRMMPDDDRAMPVREVSLAPGV
ncbi:MAG: hypothetical protein O7B26_13965, partial [Planctomycetota bacterium]|nr:hypothetical protein [Planctomycetota bacterium]